ncbi:MAG: M20 family metallo-hydrolase [candidate division WOR-3 bacterium]
MEEVFQKIESFREDMINLQRELTSRPAIGPENGGKGEKERADFLKGFIKDLGFDWEEYNAFDERIGLARPNLRVNLPGKERSKTIWIITHLDVVPPGNLSLWQTDPFSAVVKDDKIYGRGTEDNQQEMVASLFALKALKDLNKRPTYDLSLLFVADEETGSRYGIGYLVNNFSLFKEGDLILVPDAGSKDGAMIEIAEKTIFWLKFIVRGKQTHGSTPQDGLNAHRLGALFLCLLDKELPRRFREKNRLFEPPRSTFEPTKKESNCPNINTIPGEDIFYFDCRLLPEHPPEEVKRLIEELKEGFTKKYGGEISYEVVMAGESAPATSPKAEVVKRLKKAVKKVYGVKPKLKGIGGGTVAALFRKRGFPVCVWGKYEGMAHQANEYSLISNMVQDAKVYAYYALL